MKRLALAVILSLLPSSALATVPQFVPGVLIAERPAGSRLVSPALEKKTEAIAKLLRCPVCQGLSVADSPTPIARSMKQQIHDLLSAGYSEEQIFRSFEASYGEFVRLDPPKRGVNLLVWIAPVAALIAGAVVVFVVLRKLRRRTLVPRPENQDLTEYLRRARSIAYGEEKEERS